MRKTLVLGGPGSGKTRTLLRKALNAIEAGVAPNRIAAVSFTKAALKVAIDRACELFGLTPDDLPHFRTVHSLAFRELGLRRGDVLTDEHLENVAEVTGELVSTLEDPALLEGGAPAAGKSADPLLTLDHYARATGRSLRDAYDDHGSDLDWHRLLRFSRAYTQYKEDEGVLDFTDMLTSYAAGPFAPLDLELAIVDEAQDLSRGQWAVVDKAFSRAEEFVAGGDDMQQIHEWCGADIDRFLGLEEEGFEIENLPLSHRLARRPFAIAEEIGGRISRRYRRAWRPSNREGAVDWVSGAGEVDLREGKDWLLLARTRAQLPALAQAARDQGVVYSMKGESSVVWDDVRAIKAHEELRSGGAIAFSDAEALAAAGLAEFAAYDGAKTAAELGWDVKRIWHDALAGIPIERREYYLTILRRGGKLTDEPRVRVETIHGAKGAEAWGVVLSTDMTYRTFNGMERFPDAEHRVFYVGTTRAIERLVLIEPRTAYGYRI